MQYCNEHGIPHSVFLEQWSESDRAKALAYVIESGIKCGLCGTAEWEWEHDKQAYVPDTKFCWGCYYRESFSENEKGHGESITLMRNTKQYKQERLGREMRVAKLRERDEVDDDGSWPGHQH